MNTNACQPLQHESSTWLDACARGALLTLALWDLDRMDPVAGIPADSDYSRFHNLNTLAAEICAFEGEAKILAHSRH